VKQSHKYVFSFLTLVPKEWPKRKSSFQSKIHFFTSFTLFEYKEPKAIKPVWLQTRDKLDHKNMTTRIGPIYIWNIVHIYASTRYNNTNLKTVWDQTMQNQPNWNILYCNVCKFYCIKDTCTFYFSVNYLKNKKRGNNKSFFSTFC